jgi:archaellum component FlaF (FlaF/FlaG flagellin family)
MGGIAIGEGGNYLWYNAINAGLLPSVSGVYDSSSGKTTVTLTNNTSFVQMLDISYIA